MKNHLLIVLLFCCNNYTSAQPNLDEFNKIATVGNCYVATPNALNTDEKFYIQIIPPVLETYRVKTNKAFIEKEIRAKDRNTSKPVYVEVSPLIAQFVVIENDEKCLKSKAFETGISICMEKVPPSYRKLKKIVIIKNGEPVHIISEQTITKRRVIKKAEIKIISADAAKNSEHPVYEISGGAYEWEKISCRIPRG